MKPITAILVEWFVQPHGGIAGRVLADLREDHPFEQGLPITTAPLAGLVDMGGFWIIETVNSKYLGIGDPTADYRKQ